MYYELIVRVSIDESEEDQVAAACDAMTFTWRHLVNQEKRLLAGFGVRLLGCQAKRVPRGNCIGCHTGEVLDPPDEDTLLVAVG